MRPLPLKYFPSRAFFFAAALTGAGLIWAAPPTIAAEATADPELGATMRQSPTRPRPKPEAKVRAVESVGAPTAPAPIPDPSPANPAPAPAPRAAGGVDSWLDAQIELARRGFSCGPIDGVVGEPSRAALRAFQRSQDIPATGELDEATRARLRPTAPPLVRYTVVPGDLARLQPLSPTWIGKSRQSALDHETMLEALADRFHASPVLLQAMNFEVDWSAVKSGARLMVPAVDRLETGRKAARLRVLLAECVLEARDAAGQLLAHFPLEIAPGTGKPPEGELHVTSAIPRPDYIFSPETFPASQEARELGRRLILPPGPNNPVGLAWIGLDRPGCGIHGTPPAEHAVRAESPGCFRLANWDAVALLDLVWEGMPVLVEP